MLQIGPYCPPSVDRARNDIASGMLLGLGFGDLSATHHLEDSGVVVCHSLQNAAARQVSATVTDMSDKRVRALDVGDDDGRSHAGEFRTIPRQLADPPIGIEQGPMNRFLTGLRGYSEGLDERLCCRITGDTTPGMPSHSVADDKKQPGVEPFNNQMVLVLGSTESDVGTRRNDNAVCLLYRIRIVHRRSADYWGRASTLRIFGPSSSTIVKRKR